MRQARVPIREPALCRLRHDSEQVTGSGLFRVDIDSAGFTRTRPNDPREWGLKRMLGRQQRLVKGLLVPRRARTCGPFEPNQRERPASLDQMSTVDSDNPLWSVPGSLLAIE